MLSEIRIYFYIHTPFFPHFQIWPFSPQKPKNSNLTNSFLAHYPQPKMNQKSPKDPKSILILTMKLLQTYFWKTLPIDALIWLALILLAFSKSSLIGPSSSNHLKITKKLQHKSAILAWHFEVFLHSSFKIISRFFNTLLQPFQPTVTQGMLKFPLRNLSDFKVDVLDQFCHRWKHFSSHVFLHPGEQEEVTGG